jgi:hypothetical protein
MVLRTKIPDSCADLCPAKVERVLEKHFGDIYAAARELGVPGPDLRRLTWAQPSLLENALEEHELVVQQAMGVVIQALDSPDWQRRQWASDQIMSSYLARNHPLAPARRGAGVNVSAGPPRVIDYRWRTDDHDKRDAEAAEAERVLEAAERERLEAEGKQATTFEPEKLIEHEPIQPRPQPAR